MWSLLGLDDLLHFFHVVDLLQGVDDDLHLGAIVHTHLNLPLEDSLVGGEIHSADVDVHLLRDDLRYIVKHALAVYSVHLDGGIEEKLLVHFPLGVEDARAVAGLQFAGHATRPLVDLYVVLVVDEAEDVVAGNGVAA